MSNFYAIKVRDFGCEPEHYYVQGEYDDVKSYADVKFAGYSHGVELIKFIDITKKIVLDLQDETMRAKRKKVMDQKRRELEELKEKQKKIEDELKSM